jgi:hypothetical protein
MSDRYDLRGIVTGAFYKHHVVEVGVQNAKDLSAADLEEITKKLAEAKFQLRRREEADKPEDEQFDINTVIVLGQGEAHDLKEEVLSMQTVFQTFPHKGYTTAKAYPLFARGTADGKPAAQKRAKSLGSQRFRFGVRAVAGEHGARYKIGHFGGVATE